MAKEFIEREVAIQLANNHKDGTIDANDGVGQFHSLR